MRCSGRKCDNRCGSCIRRWSFVASKMSVRLSRTYVAVQGAVLCVCDVRGIRFPGVVALERLFALQHRLPTVVATFHYGQQKMRRQVIWHSGPLCSDSDPSIVLSWTLPSIVRRFACIFPLRLLLCQGPVKPAVLVHGFSPRHAKVKWWFLFLCWCRWIFDYCDLYSKSCSNWAGAISYPVVSNGESTSATECFTLEPRIIWKLYSATRSRNLQVCWDHWTGWECTSRRFDQYRLKSVCPPYMGAVEGLPIIVLDTLSLWYQILVLCHRGIGTGSRSILLYRLVVFVAIHDRLMYCTLSCWAKYVHCSSARQVQGMTLVWSGSFAKQIFHQTSNYQTERAEPSRASCSAASRCEPS